MSKDPADHGLYMCQECGNTTPIPDEVCSSCGGKMLPLDDGEEHIADDLHGEGDGGNEESLDALRDREEEESEDEYHKSFQDSDNIE